MNCSKNFYLKWGITLFIFLFSPFFMSKSYVYCEEYEEQIEAQYLEEKYLLPQHRGAPVPVEDEYMYQHSIFDNLKTYSKRSNWSGKIQEVKPYNDTNSKK